jgi:hypothetical protein
VLAAGWLWGGGSGVVSTVIVGTGVGGAITGALTMAGALMTELSGDSTLVGLLIDLTQVFDVVAQAFDHTGLPYGFGHVLVIDWVMLPVNPA